MSESIYPPESRSFESKKRVEVVTFPKRCPRHLTPMRRVQKLSGASWLECETCAREEAEGCEWNPERNREALVGERPHAPAVVSVGRENYHLCADCARLPKFARMTARPLDRKVLP